MPFSPGTGIGGHCIPCDPHYLLWQLRGDRIPAPLLSRAMESVAERPRQIVEQLSDALSASGRGVRGARILIVGVAYKPGVRDVRESPGKAILLELLERGATVDYFDPLVPSLRLDAHRVLLSTPVPDPDRYDLALVNTLHPTASYEWLDEIRLSVRSFRPSPLGGAARASARRSERRYARRRGAGSPRRGRTASDRGGSCAVQGGLSGSARNGTPRDGTAAQAAGASALTPGGR